MVVREAMYYVYVIESVEGYHYTGMTEDIHRRLEEHNNHLLGFWTKRGSRWKIVHLESLQSKTEALRREKWLKSGIGREYIKTIAVKGP
jgi:putative endonuclease